MTHTAASQPQQQNYHNPYDSPFKWQLKDLVMVVALGVVFGFVYWALVQAWNALAISMGPAGDLAQHFLQGGWLLVAPLDVAITRKTSSRLHADQLNHYMEIL